MSIPRFFPYTVKLLNLLKKYEQGVGEQLPLGRVFDQRSDYTIYRLLKLAQANPAVFSKEALAERKRRLAYNADEWLPEYLKTAYEPDTKDFRCLRSYVDKRRKVYLKKLRSDKRSRVCS